MSPENGEEQHIHWLMQSVIPTCDRLQEKPKPSIMLVATHYNYKYKYTLY